MRMNLTSPLLAAFGVLGLAVSIPLSLARAQSAGPSVATGQATAPAAQRSRNGGLPQGTAPTVAPAPAFAQMPQPQLMGNGPACMVSDGDNLYILQGPRLLKVNKGDLRVVRETMLPGPPMMQQRGGQSFEPPARTGGQVGQPGGPAGAGGNK